MKIFCILLSILVCPECFGGARHFTFLYEAPTSAPGSCEVENYATLQWADEKSGQFRHELEIGVTNRLQLGIYVANWEYADHAARYENASLEAIYNLSNPVIDPVGISIYQEYAIGRRNFEWESKLIAQKNFGPLIVAYNLTLEADWSGQDLTERDGELQQALGASYELSPRLSVGLEMLHEFVFPDWRSSRVEKNFFVGPNISYRHRSWFATLTTLRELTSNGHDYQVRLIFGLEL